MILDHSQPVVVGHLSNKIRITVLGNPITDAEKGVAASIRIVNPQKLTREDFIKKNTATAQMLDLFKRLPQTLKSTLQPIISKLSDMRNVTAKDDFLIWLYLL